MTGAAQPVPFRQIDIARMSCHSGATDTRCRGKGRSNEAERPRRMLKWIDLPPVWLALFLGVAWVQAERFSYGLGFGSWPVADLLGGLLVGAGVVLMALALYEMRRHRTTIVPHRDADVMVQTGIYSRTRNPIYLGDLLILAGFILRWDAVLSLPLVPIFLWWIERHFVIPEEDRLRRKFRADFARYCQKTRRWV